MKHIDQLFKESLENHELPYDEAAWASMAKRLDSVKAPVSTKKWWITGTVAATLVGAIAVVAVYNREEQVNQVAENAVTQPIQTSTDETRSSSAVSTPNPSQKEQTTSSTNSTLPQDVNETGRASANNRLEEISSTNKNVPADNHTLPPKTENGNSLANSASKGNPNVDILPAQFAKTTICSGEEIEISNPNNNHSVTVLQNGKTVTLKPLAKRTFIAEGDGIDVVAGKNVQHISVVKPNSKLYISVDPTLIYSKGIPEVEFEVSGNEDVVKWQVEKHPYETKGGKLIVHPYKGQDITVKAISKDGNGCTVEEEKSIRINEKYNLQAASGFRPTSGDPRTNQFMPYALITRNVSFEMYIYDSRSGLTLFKTNDASNGWDGKNMNTGEMLKPGSTCIWKVILHQPNPGEPAEYGGVITISE